jgi:predicted RNase H-like nuclease (RuvC/YqgF family)
LIATEQANARVTELESAGANTAKEAKTERSKLLAELDEANEEIERLRTEIEQQKATPPEQGNSVSQPPAEASPSPRE